MKVSACTDVGLWRQRNEDAYLVKRLPGGWVLAVADGIGGMKGGDVASRMAVETLEEWLENGLPSPSPGEYLREMVLEANRRIYHRGRQTMSPLSAMGTTFTVALLWQGALWMAHVGDSRAYLIRQGRILQLTQDHSLTGELVEEGQLGEEEAMHHPQRNLLTRALGSREFLTVDIARHDLQLGDRVLLATDGLTSLVTSKEILQMVERMEDQPVEVLTKELVEEARRRGGYDNITVALAWVDEAEDLEGRAR
ncbi:MAG: Stp1/IreP family PP2C-type Ser/Thr phosphatase [Clostridiales bacterium]|nr:Stp1/IreP family PP2C-type Ser/Thr phosphatase [Clostridiales bacterium]